MRRASHKRVPADLAAVQRRFAQWRAKRRPGARIPEPLWKLAAQAAAKFGLNRTKAALQLDYYSLQHHLYRATESRAGQTARMNSQPTFVECKRTPPPCSRGDGLAGRASGGRAIAG